MRRKVVAFSLFFILAAPAGAARKPRNFRLMPKPGERTSVEESTAPARGEPIKLMAGRWTPEARALLERFIAERGKDAPGYDKNKPPVAVLPWSDALVAGDPAELCFLRMTARAEFKFDDSFWEVVPIAYGRQPARAAYEQFVKLSSSVWSSQPAYQQYRKLVLSSYLGLCRGVGRKECRSYLARLWTGYKESEAQDYAAAALADEKKLPAARETIRSEERDPEPLTVRRGLRVIPEMRDLAVKLRAAGVDLWIVDDLPQPVLLAATADYGVDPSRVAGIRSGDDGPRLSATVLKPIPWRGGKAEIVRKAVGRPADLVLGRDMGDIDLLSDGAGAGARLVLTGDPALVKLAAESGWPVQPALAR